MEIKPRLFVFLAAILLSVNTQASGVWVSSEGEFGANFPNEPNKIGGETSLISAYAYQSVKEFVGGLVLYSIAVTPITIKVTPEEEKAYLYQVNTGFVKSMGQDPSVTNTKLDKFESGRNRLNYDFGYDVQGVPLMKTYGFWLVDKNRAIRVSISYTKGLSTKDQHAALSFLDSFMLITKEH